MIIKFILSWGMVLCFALFNSIGALIIKYYVNQMGAIKVDGLTSYFFRLFTTPTVMFGIVCIFLSAFAWIIALSRMELSIAYPAGVGLNFILVLAGSFLFFGENINTYKICGVLLILISLYLLHKA